MSLTPCCTANSPQGDRWHFFQAPANAAVPLLARRIPPAQPETDQPLEPVPVPGGYLRHLVATVDTQGQPYIAFQRWSAAPLHPRWEVWCAHRDNKQAQWPAAVVDAQVSADDPMRLVVDAHGHVHLAYLNTRGYELRYAQRHATGWRSEIVGTLAPGSAFDLTVIDSAPEIVFLEANLYLIRATASPTAWHFQVLQDEAPPEVVMLHPRWPPPCPRERRMGGAS